jgi:hypothetical protein
MERKGEHARRVNPLLSIETIAGGQQCAPAGSDAHPI